MQTISLKTLQFANNTYGCNVSSMFNVLSLKEWNFLVDSVEQKKNFYSWNVGFDITAASAYVKIAAIS